MATLPVPDPNMSTEEMIRQTYLKVTSFDKLFVEQQNKIAALEKEVTSLKTDVRALQNTLNTREQEARALNIRVSGLAFT